MSAIICTCLKASIRASIPIVRRGSRINSRNVLIPSSNSIRFIHAFSPTVSLQKKKNSAINDEFEEFEEDLMEEEEISSNTTTSSSTSNNNNNKISIEEKHSALIKEINLNLNKTSFQLKSFKLSFKPIEKLFELSNNKELILKSLEILKLWRLKGFKIPELKMKLILIRLNNLGLNNLLLEVLNHRELYGLDLLSIRDLDGLFLNLTSKSISSEEATELEIKESIKNCFDSLNLTKFTSKITKESYPDLYGNIMVSKLCLTQGGELTNKGLNLLEELKELIGEENLLLNFNKLSSKSKNQIIFALRIVVGELNKLNSNTNSNNNKNGKEVGELLKLFGTLEKRVVDSKAGKGLKGLGMI